MSTRIDPAHPVSPASRSAVDLVEARDRAILEFLEDGPATFQSVCASLREDPGWSTAHREEACTLALRRLTLKHDVMKGGDTYMLARRG